MAERRGPSGTIPQTAVCEGPRSRNNSGPVNSGPVMHAANVGYKSVPLVHGHGWHVDWAKPARKAGCSSPYLEPILAAAGDPERTRVSPGGQPYPASLPTSRRRSGTPAGSLANTTNKTLVFSELASLLSSSNSLPPCMIALRSDPGIQLRRVLDTAPETPPETPTETPITYPHGLAICSQPEI